MATKQEKITVLIAALNKKPSLNIWVYIKLKLEGELWRRGRVCASHANDPSLIPGYDAWISPLP